MTEPGNDAGFNRYVVDGEVRDLASAVAQAMTDEGHTVERYDPAKHDEHQAARETQPEPASENAKQPPQQPDNRSTERRGGRPAADNPQA